MNEHRIPDSDELVAWWGAWILAAIVAGFTLGYACARNNRPVIVLALVVTIFCTLEGRRLHRRDVDDAEARTRSVARLRGVR